MLNIKPVMDVDTAGKLRVVRKVRARKRSLIDLANETLKAIQENPQIGNIGPTIASHTGFGCVAVFSMATSERK